MEIPKNIKICDVHGKTVAYLSPQADGLKNVYADCRLNAESTLEFMLPANSPKLSEITPECQIWTNERVYNLLKPEATDVVRDENNKLWAKFMAVERWSELGTKYPEPYISNDPTVPTPADLAVIIVGGGNDLSGGRYQVGTAGHALYAVLSGSGWSVGVVDILGIHDLEAEKVSRLELVKMIQNIWGGYLVWDSVNKIVHLRSRDTWQNYTGFQIRYKKNLRHITRTQSNRIITKLYAFGKDDLDIASVNDGKKYVTNNSYTQKEYVGIYRNPDISDPQELKDAAIAELTLICRPKNLYRVKTVDLRTLPEYSHEDFVIGDLADVIDPDVAPESPRPRIVRHKYNIFRPWECELELGDPEERLAEKLKSSFDTSGYIDNTLTSRGQLPGYKIVDGSLAADKIKTNELVVGTNVGLGTAQDAEGVTTIVGGIITTDYIKALGLKVGDEIQMGPNAKISWSQVSNQPFIPSTASDVGALPAGTHIPSTAEITQIAANYIATPYLVTNISRVNSNLSLGEGHKTRSSISFDGIGGIDAYDDVLHISAMAGIAFEASTSFSNTVAFDGIVDFSTATVKGLNVVAKFG